MARERQELEICVGNHQSVTYKHLILPISCRNTLFHRSKVRCVACHYEKICLVDFKGFVVINRHFHRSFLSHISVHHADLVSNYRLRVRHLSERDTTSLTLPAVDAERSVITSKRALARPAVTPVRK